MSVIQGFDIFSHSLNAPSVCFNFLIFFASVVPTSLSSSDSLPLFYSTGFILLGRLCLHFLNRCLSRDKHWPNQFGQGTQWLSLHFCIKFITEEGQAETGTTAMEGCFLLACLACFFFFFFLFFVFFLDDLHRGDTTHSGLGPPASVINQENTPHTSLWANFMGTFFLNWSSLFPSWQKTNQHIGILSVSIPSLFWEELSSILLYLSWIQISNSELSLLHSAVCLCRQHLFL
jgi:hypothetical protein